jgi:hypothetical protein
MGSFYTNITLRIADRSRVKLHLLARGLSAFLSRAENGTLVVYDRGAEEQDPAVLDRLAADLSSRFGGAALAILNQDDDVLTYSLFEAGRRTDEYNSAPDYFDQGAYVDRGGQPERLAQAFGVPERTAQLAAILGLSASEDDVVFEMDRHEQLVEALALPRCAIGTGYDYLETGEYPTGLHARGLRAYRRAMMRLPSNERCS